MIIIDQGHTMTENVLLLTLQLSYAKLTMKSYDENWKKTNEFELL